MRTWRGCVSGWLLAGAGLALVPLVAGAAEAPGVRRGPGGPEALERGAYLGISSVAVDEALGSQLGLPRGVGLRVEYIDPDSPANGALQRHDVLHKLDDQILVNLTQLAVLVRLHQPGEAVSLTFLRGGKSQTATVQLAEKELPPLQAYDTDRPQIRINPPQFMAPQGPGYGWHDRPGPGGDWQKQALEAVEEALRAAPLAGEEVERLLKGVRERLPKAGGQGAPVTPTPALPPGPPVQGALTYPGGVSVVLGSATGDGYGVTSCQSLVVDGRAASLTVDGNGRRRLVISDGAKGVVYEGSLDTPGDRAAVPADYAELVRQLEASRPGAGGGQAHPAVPVVPQPAAPPVY